MEEIIDQGTLREQLLRMAIAARTMESVGARRRAVSGILRLSFSPQMVGIQRDVRAEPVLSETELFEEVYADHGAEYWRAVIDDRELGDDSLALLLALHLTADLFARWDHRFALFEVSKREECKAALVQNQAGDTGARLTELNRNPNTQHLVSESLRRFLSPPPIVAAPAVDKKAPDRNVSRSVLTEFLSKKATKQLTKLELRKLTREAFPGRCIPNRLFDEVYGALPEDQRRFKGEHKRTLSRAQR